MNTAHFEDFCYALASCESIAALEHLATLPGREYWSRDHNEAWQAKRREILAGQHESDTGEVMEELPQGF